MEMMTAKKPLSLLCIQTILVDFLLNFENVNFKNLSNLEDVKRSYFNFCFCFRGVVFT